MSTYRIGVSSALPYASNSLNRGPDAETAGEPLTAVFDKLTKWIPGDALAIYTPGVTIIGAFDSEPSVLLLVAMLIATPLLTLGFAFSTGAPLTQAVWLSAVLACVAFAIWSLSVPMNGWQSISFVADNKGLMAVGAAIIGTVFGYFAEGLTRRSVS